MSFNQPRTSHDRYRNHKVSFEGVTRANLTIDDHYNAKIKLKHLFNEQKVFRLAEIVREGRTHRGSSKDVISRGGGTIGFKNMNS